MLVSASVSCFVLSSRPEHDTTTVANIVKHRTREVQFLYLFGSVGHKLSAVWDSSSGPLNGELQNGLALTNLVFDGVRAANRNENIQIVHVFRLCSGHVKTSESWENYRVLATHVEIAGIERWSSERRLQHRSTCSHEKFNFALKSWSWASVICVASPRTPFTATILRDHTSSFYVILHFFIPFPFFFFFLVQFLEHYSLQPFSCLQVRVRIPNPQRCPYPSL